MRKVIAERDDQQRQNKDDDEREIKMPTKQVPGVLDLSVIHELDLAQIRNSVIIRHHVRLADRERGERCIGSCGVTPG
jgi:hypothetical protein